MAYIVVEYTEEATWYIEESYRGVDYKERGKSITLSQDRVDAYRFSMSEAVELAEQYKLSIEKADSLITTLYRRLKRALIR